MKKLSDQSFFGIPWLVCAAFAFLIAVMYWYVWPNDLDAQGIVRSILRYAHSFVWVLLGTSAALYSMQKDRLVKPAQYIAKASLVVYALFLVTLMYYTL